MDKSNTSKITGKQNPVPAQSNEIGTPHFATGFGTISSLETPAQVDLKLQASLPVSVISSLVETVDKDYNLTGYRMTEPIPAKDLETAVAMLEVSLTPLNKSEIMQELTMLQVKTVNRTVKQKDQELMLSAYAEELQYFPSDIVRYTLRSLALSSKWWPAWHDVAKELVWRTEKRQFKLDALQRGAIDTPTKYANLINQSLKRI